MEIAVKESKVADRASILVNKRVKVVPIIRGSSWLGKGHDGEFLYTGCIHSYVLPLDARKGQLITILSREEQEFFEKELYLNPGDLSIHKKKDNFWHKFRVNVDKNGMELNLSDAIDNLRFRVLKVCGHVAPSWDEKFNKMSYKFALVDYDQEVDDRVKIKDKRKKAYKFLGSIENNWEKMNDFLRVFGRKPAPNSSKDFMQAEIDKLIEDSVTLDILIGLIDDPHYDIKVFIENAVQARAILKTGKTQYSLPGGDIIGKTISETIEYLSDPKNQDVYLSIQAQIEESR